MPPRRAESPAETRTEGMCRGAWAGRLRRYTGRWRGLGMGVSVAPTFLPGHGNAGHVFRDLALVAGLLVMVGAFMLTIR
jgi:hypothetical protein